MTETMDTRATAPWYFWAVAVVALLWNAFGGYDYAMSHLQGLAYFRQMGMTDAQIAFLGAYPAWMHAVWAIGVWGSVLGSILLLLRSRWALHAFAASLLGAVGNLAYLLTNPGGGGIVFPAVIIAICMLLIWFSRTMTKRGVLR
jgi:hypothetical protein